MTPTEFLSNYVVPVVAGVFILFVIAGLTWLGYFVLKKAGMFRVIKNMMISRRKKKLMDDEDLIEYCVHRINEGWSEGDVRTELLLANKYASKRIDEVAYIFLQVKKEMQGASPKTKAQDLP